MKYHGQILVPGLWFHEVAVSAVFCVSVCVDVYVHMCVNICFYLCCRHRSPPPLSFYIGGSYKKIGYYDSTKGNLSWYGNDKWIGEPHLSFSSLLYFPLHHCPLHSLSFPISPHLSLLLFFPFPVFHLSCLGHLL